MLCVTYGVTQMQKPGDFATSRRKISNCTLVILGQFPSFTCFLITRKGKWLLCMCLKDRRSVFSYIEFIWYKNIYITRLIQINTCPFLWLVKYIPETLRETNSNKHILILMRTILMPIPSFHHYIIKFPYSMRSMIIANQNSCHMINQRTITHNIGLSGH